MVMLSTYNSITTDILIDIVVYGLNEYNPIIIAENIEQYYSREVNIDYVQFYIEKNYGIKEW